VPRRGGPYLREFALHCETGRQARRVAFSLIGAPGYACVHAHPHDLLPACSLPWVGGRLTAGNRGRSSGCHCTSRAGPSGDGVGGVR
jgi:hypothetical protein